MEETYSLAADADATVLKRRSVRGAAMTFAAQGTRSVLQLGSQIVLAHLLLPTEFGLIAMVAPVLNLVQIFNELGLTQATVQRAEISHSELSSLFWVNVAISSGLALLMALASPLVAWIYGEPSLVLITICLASLLVMSGISAQQIALMNRRMQFGALATIDVACMIAAVVAGVTAAWLGFGYWSLVLMQAANSLTVMVLAWGLSDWRPSWPRRGVDIGALLRFGGHLTAFNILGYVESSLSNILIGALNGAMALGLYDRAFKLVVVPWSQFTLPIARVAVTLLARLHGTEDLYVRANDRMLQGLLLVAVPGLVWVAMVSDLLVPLVLGPEWVQAAPIVTALAVGACFFPLGTAGYWLFVSQNRVREQLRYGAISGALLLVSMLIGVHWGAVGIADTYAGSAILVQGASLWGATRRGPVRLPGVLRALYPIVVALLLAGLSVAVAERMLERAGAGTGLRLGAGLLLSYGVCAAALVCMPPGLRILRDVWDLRSTLHRAPGLASPALPNP